MEAEKQDDVIKLGDIFRVFWKNIILIAVITVAAFVVGIIYTFGIVSPQYTSSATFLVAISSTGSSEDVDYTNSLRLVTTAAELVTQEVVLDPVATANSLTSSELGNMVSVSYSTDSFLVTVSVECSSSTLSMRLANALVESLIEVANTDGSGADMILKNTIYVTSSATRGVYSSPNKVLYLAIFLVGGLVVGCIVAYVKEFCSSKFRSSKDIESYLGIKVVGYFRDDTKKDKNVPKDVHVARKVELIGPSMRAYEPYNKLFTNIKYSNIDRPYRTIMFTSSQEQELKSTTVGNFACSIASNQSKVVVVDLDLRKPVQHKLFGVRKELGVSEYVSSHATLNDIIKHGKYGVDVISAGEKVINPLVVIESAAMKRLLAELSNLYDYIIIDAPPVVACADALSISKLCDGVVFNVSMRDANKKKVALAIESLKGIGAEIVGINVTKAVAPKHDEFYRHYYSDSYYSDSSDGKPARAQSSSADKTAKAQGNSKKSR